MTFMDYVQTLPKADIDESLLDDLRREDRRSAGDCGNHPPTGRICGLFAANPVVLSAFLNRRKFMPLAIYLAR